jgi:hypothetical protein
MYPDGELSRLAAAKAVIRMDIAVRRAECVQAAAEVARPLEWLDRVLALWRRVSPMAKVAIVPLGLLLRRWVMRRHKVLGALLRWGPLAAGAVRGFSFASNGRSSSAGEE